VQEIENRLDEWLEGNNRKHTLSAELARLDKHVRRHRGEWLVFLHEPQVPPTNNHAEQMLRPAVSRARSAAAIKPRAAPWSTAFWPASW